MIEGWILWKNKDFVVKTPENPHISPEEGCHIVVYTRKRMKKSWDSPVLAGRAFELAAKVSEVLIEEKIADWANIQNNQNWDLLPGNEFHFHIHIYGRKKSGKTWCRPVELPKLPGTFKNRPLPEKQRKMLASELKEVTM